ncbi:MAG: co-chaperone GroES [Candidatus Gracilibacteria bacterium]
MAKLRPTSDHIVVKAIEEEITSKSGIVIPETANKERPMKGEVIAVGPGKVLDNGQKRAMEVKKGDKVLFTKYGPTEVKVDGEELLVLNESDVLAVIE